MEKLCFVIMPFSSTPTCSEKEWTEVFEHVIKPAIEESGLDYRCKRSSAGRGAIIADILSNLNSANLVIADLTDRNPNVFYELGVRHSLKKGTILISQNLKDIPFDLMPYGVIEYNLSPSGVKDFKNRIRSLMLDLDEHPEKQDNPVADFLTATGKQILSQDELSKIVNNQLDSATSKLKEQFELTYNQLKEMISDVAKDRDYVGTDDGTTERENQDVTGVYQGGTGILELRQEGNHIEGRYQFYSDEFVGNLIGTINLDVIKFKYHWNNGKYYGSGLFYVSPEDQSLDGYYFLSMDITDIASTQDFENKRKEWYLTRVGDLG